MKQSPPIQSFLASLILCFASTISANNQLDSLKHISAAGAPFLTLKMLDQAQPGIDEALYEWILWEQERYRILNEWEQWNDLLIRIEGLPADLPEPFLQQASTYRIRAYIKLGQNETARRLLRQQLWQIDAGGSTEYKAWRELIIETYLNQQQNENARIAMLRFQQDFGRGDKDRTLLRARVLMQSERYDEVIALLDSRLDWQSLSMKLMAEYRNGLHSAIDIWQLAQKRIELTGDDKLQLAAYWSIAAVVAKAISLEKEVLALEKRLSLKIKLEHSVEEINADQLWMSYLSYARLIGNRSELLVGDDQSWLELAKQMTEVTPVKARSLFALLMVETQDDTIRQQSALLFLQTLDLEDEAHQQLVSSLFNHSEQFRSASRIPDEIRFHLVDLALKKSDIVEATRLMSGLKASLSGVKQFEWLLRQARVLLLGGEVAQGNDVLTELLDQYTEPDKKNTDRILQVLFDLQTIKADKEAIIHFRRLTSLSIEPAQQREILFWMADSFKSLEQYEKAALLYLQSAMLPGPDAMDPWAQTARFNAAESLQKGGLVDDARRIYNALLQVTKEPTRQSVLRHKIQQLWLTQSKG